MNDLNLKSISTSTLQLTDYSMLTPKLAKVVIAFTGAHDKQSINDAIAAKMEYLAAPVENSFRIVASNVAVGFVRANRPVRAVKNETELRANYKVMSSNILMDASDETLWEIKQGASGKYLARHGEEDLSGLVEASICYRAEIPRIRQISLASAAKNEFVAFATNSGDMDYGFAVATNNSKVKLVSHATSQATVVPYTCVASIVRVGIPKSVHNKIIQAGISRADKDQSIEYYKRLFSYAPAYLSEIINQIETDAVA